MTLASFRQALAAALDRHFPATEVTITEARGVVLNATAKLNVDTFIAVYFSALTGKTSYAPIHQSHRLVGYDNYRFWHFHPPTNPDSHLPCAEPTPDEAIATLVEVSETLL